MVPSQVTVLFTSAFFVLQLEQTETLQHCVSVRRQAHCIWCLGAWCVCIAAGCLAVHSVCALLLAGDPRYDVYMQTRAVFGVCPTAVRAGGSWNWTGVCLATAAKHHNLPVMHPYNCLKVQLSLALFLMSYLLGCCSFFEHLRLCFCRVMLSARVQGGGSLA